MKYLLPLFIFTLVACDVPSQRRQLIKSGSSNVANPNEISGQNNFNSGNTTVNSATNGTGFENCSLAPKGSTISLGSIGVCQNSLDQTQIKFQSSTSDSSMRTCLIPTYKQADGSSLYLSSQPQCTLTEANKIYTGKLLINRSGFENYQMNGVIVMKENIMPSYYECMNAYAFYTQNRNCTYEQDYQVCRQQLAYYPNSHQTCCQRQAQNYQTLVCNTFKSNFGSQYLDIRLR
jgi:hypothetical protein